MSVVGHQHSNPHRDIFDHAMLSQQTAVNHEIAITKEGMLWPIAALSDIVRRAGQPEARKASHGKGVDIGHARVDLMR